MILHSWPMITEENPNGVDEKCKQQNATDFTCDVIKIPKFHSSSHEKSKILKDRTVHCNFEEMDCVEITDKASGDKILGWQLDRGYYQTVSNIWVRIPEHTAGWVVQRSSLNRNGVVVMGSLYDSGYYGPIASTIYVHHPYGVFIEQGARIGQFILANAEMLSLYSGQYQNTERT